MRTTKPGKLCAVAPGWSRSVIVADRRHGRGGLLVVEIRTLVARSAGTVTFEANAPLHRRAPARDEYGHPLGDFMVLIPRLRERPAHDLADALVRLQAVLVSFTEVVFVDLNVPLNLLWVSVRPRPGVILELFAAMKLVLPEARLVGHQRDFGG